MEAGRADTVAPSHRWGLGAFLVVELVFLVASTSLAVVLTGHGPVSAGVLALALAAPTVVAAGLAILITRLRGNGPRTDLRLRWSWRGLRLGLMFGFGGMLVTIPASLVYTAIVGRRWGRWAALVVTTVVFALAHLEFARAPLLVVVAIPIALARFYSGGLLASIVTHQVTNLLPGIVLLLGLTGAISLP